MNTIKKLESLLPKVMSPDRYYFSRELKNLKKLERRRKSKTDNKADQVFPKKLAALEKRMSASARKRDHRFRNKPVVSVDPDLPICSKKHEIINAIKENNIVIISGQTGSGKTTQIPKLCLMAGRGVNGMIGCTQPRRIAAISTAARIAEELGEEIGGFVSYKIRFDEKAGDNAYIKIMTDGVLLAETQNDPYLNNYDTIIVDEAHERSVNIDIILGIVKRLLNKRRDLKLIITSATIDTEKFSRVFNDAPVIEVSGRMYPVEIRHMPNDDEDKGYAEHAADAALSLFGEGMSGDILVFMPTEQDIRDTCDILEKKSRNAYITLPLFARMPVSQQKQIFNRTSRRKIIVSTNIAETSLTIPNIRYVVDTGLARIKEYSPSSGIVSLPVKAISQSSADQRAGRCGRVSEGVCVRLFNEEDYILRDRFSRPEIFRTSLAEVLLKMIFLKIYDVTEFPFIDRPKQQAINEGFGTLQELGTVEKDKNGNYFLTERGMLMSKLPMEPRLSRILIEANERKCLREALIIVSMLTIQDPRERPVGKEESADEMHRKFVNHASDFLTLLNIWNKHHAELKESKSMNRIRKFCRENFLSFNRMKEVREIHGQISQMLEEQGITGKKGKPAAVIKEFGILYNDIHQSILTGFLINIACRKHNNIYSASKQREVKIFPGSGLFSKSRDWIICAEIVQTSNLYARTVANIDVKWLEEAGGKQCEYSYRDPFWDSEAGEVIAFENATLFGLEILRNRRKVFGKVNPAEATRVFIQEALVKDINAQSAVESADIAPGNTDLFLMDRFFSFMEYNAGLVKKISGMENRIRRKIMIADSLAGFFMEKLENVFNTRTLDEYIKEKKGDSFLKINFNDLISYFPEAAELDDYPESITVNGNRLSLEYRFDPESEKDGITVKIPINIIQSIDLNAIELKIPGLVKEKVTAVIKAIPGQHRKNLTPVPETILSVIDNVSASEKPLIIFIKEYLNKKYKIPYDIIDNIDLPVHLNLRFLVIDKNGIKIISDRDPEKLAADLTAGFEKDIFMELKRKWEKGNINSWDFDDLPECFTARHSNGMELRFSPGLSRDKDGNISLMLFRDSKKALLSHKAGVGELIARELSEKIDSFKNIITVPDESKKACAMLGGQASIRNAWRKRVSEFLLKKNIRSKKGFEEYTRDLEPILLKDAANFNMLINEILAGHANILEIIARLEKQNRSLGIIAGFLKKIRTELDKLLQNDFPAAYTDSELESLPRYIKALTVRAERGCVNVAKDQQKEKETLVLIDMLEKEKNLSADASEEKKKALRDLSWLIEEYKISVFAPEIKTNAKVSVKIIQEKIDGIRSME